MLTKLSVLLGTAAFVLACPPASAQVLQYDFCTIQGAEAEALTPQIWGAESVHTYIRQLLAHPAVIDTPLAAFPLAYVALSHERDVQRCGGSLGSNDRSQRLIGDLLADLMSRWMMKTVAACADGATSPDLDAGMCAAVHRQRDENYDALRATVDMTAVYLTSHMGMALAAVVFDDPFWNQEFPEPTHCLAAPCSRDVLEARLRFIAQYKPLYDENNAFLGANLLTVISALHEGCFVTGDLISIGSGVAGQLPFLGEVFGNIRDQTFAAAIAVARTTNPLDHPMITRRGGLNVVQYERFATFTSLPAPLRAAEAHGRGILASQAFTWLFHPLGSLSWQQLAAERPSQNPACNYPLLGNLP